MKQMPISHKQQGAVLVIALVILTVLTLAGVASMSGSSLELRAASNSQLYTEACEAAASRIEFAISRDDANPVDFSINIPDVTDSTTWPVQTCDDGDGCPEVGNTTTAAKVEFTGYCQKLNGYSMEDGKTLHIRAFEVTAEAQSSNSAAKCTQVMGVRYPSASC